MRHPLLGNSTRVTLWWLAWLMMAAGQSLLIWLVYGSSPLTAVTDGVISMAAMGLLGLGIWYPVRYLPKEGDPLTGTLLNNLVTGLLTIAIWLMVTRYGIRALVTDKEGYDLLWHSVLIFRITAAILIYALIVLTYHLLMSATRLAERAARQAQLEVQVHEGELRMLRSQINPHFLFNSLNSINSLTLTDPAAASEMIIKLSDFMRYSLSMRGDQPVTLGEEMESLRLYLQIERVRFGERLVIEEETEPECLNALMPGMLLQPIYENAVKHGLWETTGEIILKTVATMEEEMVVISVTNTLDPEAAAYSNGTGIGLRNVASRLELFFGERAGLDVKPGDESFTVTIRFPFRTTQ